MKGFKLHLVFDFTKNEASWRRDNDLAMSFRLAEVSIRSEKLQHDRAYGSRLAAAVKIGLLGKSAPLPAASFSVRSSRGRMPEQTFGHLRLQVAASLCRC